MPKEDAPDVELTMLTPRPERLAELARAIGADQPDASPATQALLENLATLDRAKELLNHFAENPPSTDEEWDELAMLTEQTATATTRLAPEALAF
ncbi:MAG TPA: hypothetical protein QGH10_24540 [Armatimonadota bacterium]|nr:hypothetical protein [Armatimonadota bacterium]